MNSTQQSLRLNRDDALLIIVDVQAKLVPHIPKAPAVIANIIKLIKAAAILKVPVVVTEQEKLGETVNEIRSVLPEIKPVGKSSFSCFGSESFQTQLTGLKRGSLIIAGIEAHVCVTQTALDAAPHYRTHVVADATASRTEPNWQFGLNRLRNNGVTITTTEMVIFELLEKAGTEEFRAVLPIVK